MGNMHLVTGYAGKSHVTASDHGAMNSAIFGTGEYVLGKGNKLSASVISNNQIRIYDGDLMMQGRHVRLEEGKYVDLTVENGTQDTYRNDLIVARYTKNTSTGVEDCELVVIKGTAVTSNPSDPSYTKGNLLENHDVRNDMLLYRVPLVGLNVQNLVCLFETRTETFGDLGNKQNKTSDLTAETTIADGDYFPFYDVSASANKKTLWSNVVAKIRTALFGTTNGVLKANGSGTISAMKVDNTPTAGSANLVTSGGVKSYAAALDSNGKVKPEHIRTRIIIVEEPEHTLAASEVESFIRFASTITEATLTIPDDLDNAMFPLGTSVEVFLPNGTGVLNIKTASSDTTMFTPNGNKTSVSSSGCYPVFTLTKVYYHKWVVRGDFA